MSLFAKAKAIALVFCWSPPLVATICTGSSCPNIHDEVSLMQETQSVVNKRRPTKANSIADAKFMDTEEKQPEVTETAMIKSMPAGDDEGAVIGAYERNLDDIRGTMEKQVEHKLRFDKKVRDQRKLDREEIDESLQKDKDSLYDTLNKEQDEVEEVADRRQEVQDEAQKEIQRAKASVMAHEIKKNQVENAAVAGRLEGERQGYERSAAKIHTEMQHLSHKHEMEELAEERRAARKHLQEVEDAINDGTRRIHDEQLAYASKMEKETHEDIHSLRARTHLAKDAIEGPEAIKNKLDEDAADTAKERAAEQVDAAQEAIHHAELGDDHFVAHIQ
jgi:hypothetical protein